MDVREALKFDCGAKFYRGDLHIHLIAGSHDVSDISATPQAIVAQANADEAFQRRTRIYGVAP